MLDIEAFDQNWQLLELDFNKKIRCLRAYHFSKSHHSVLNPELSICFWLECSMKFIFDFGLCPNVSVYYLPLKYNVTDKEAFLDLHQFINFIPFLLAL